MGLRRARSALFAIAAPAVVALAATGALAQQKPSAPKARAPHAAPAKKPAADAGAAPGTGAQAGAGAPGLAAPAPVAVAGSTGSADAGLVESKTLDGGTHVFKFTELDIEGRLKSPQLVYFLRRVRAEFAAGDLGHRSFMGEMSETRKESSF
jgi:hypothetical protein